VTPAAATFAARVTELCEEHPNASAVEFEQQWITWGDIARRRDLLERLLDDGGVGRRDPVGLVVRERPPTVAALLALLAHGHPVVVIQSIASDREVCIDIERLELAAVVAEARDWTRQGFLAVVDRIGAVGYALGDNPDEVAPVAGTSPLAVRHPTVVDEVAVLVPTSGTSGPPRRHAVSVATVDGAGAVVQVRDPEQTRGATISAVPLSSIGGLMGLVSSVWRGRPIAVMERFDVDQWAALVREHRPRRIGVPPAVIPRILERALPAELFADVQVLTTGSAPLDPVAARAFADRYDVAVLNAYGATEFGGPVVAWRDEDWAPWNSTKLGSAGRALPGVDVRLARDGTSDEDGASDVGVLEVRKSAGEWVRTTDLVRIDDDGFVWVLDRVDDVIVRGGFKVRAADVEAALRTHDAVDEAVVVGIPDARLGAVPAAMVTLSAGATATAEELLAHVRDQVAPYKAPTVVQIVDEIPRNAMMKPRRGHIRDVLGAPPREDAR
jgi:acyl-coenzyme A synthetase/AMP-(fatty) acid ligase